MKIKIIFQLIFSIASIILISKLIFFENSGIDLKFFFVTDTLLLILLLIVLNLNISYLFFLSLSSLTEKKLSYGKITNTFIQGGIVNQLLPGSGLIFKYFKFNSEQNINIAEYSAGQVIFYIQRIFVFFLLSIVFGFLTITWINFTYLFLLLFVISITLFISYKYRNFIVDKVLAKLQNFQKLRVVIIDFISVRKLASKKKLFLLGIVLLFIFQGLFECFVFLQIFKLFHFDISFYISSFLWMSTSLAISSILAFTNFFGAFELLLAYTSTFFNSSFVNIVVIIVSYKLLNIFSQIIIILMNSIFLYLRKE